MSGPDRVVPYDQVAAAAQVLRDLGHVPGPDPIIELEHLVTLLFARDTRWPAPAAETHPAAGWGADVLERLDRVSQQCPTGLAPPAAPASEGGTGRPGRPGGHWQATAAGRVPPREKP